MAKIGDPLSQRELSVLELLVAGSTNREIARDLDISHNTVKVHVRNIFAKLDVSSRTEAATVGIQQGIVNVSDGDAGVGTESLQSDVDLETGQTQPDLTGHGQALPAEVQIPETTTHWRAAALALLLIVVLLLAALAAVQFLGGDEADATESPTPSIESIREEPMGASRWFVGQPLPQERSNMALAAIGLDLYQIGGEVNAGVVNLVDVFQTDSGEWRSASSKPTAVADAGAAVLFGEIYVPGGRLADGRPTSVVEAYSPANNAWRPVTPIPEPAAGALVLSDGNLLYFIGGWDGENYRADGYTYDPGTDSWHSLPPMSQGRAHGTGGILRDRLYVVGGFDGAEELNSCEYYDLVERKWFDCLDMLLPRAGAGAAVLGNKLLYVIGGGIDTEVPFAEVYDADSNEWQRIELPMLDNAPAWYHLGVTNVETRIYALGGRKKGEIISDSYTYMPLIHQTFLPAVGRNE
jgi:DNA-binding CsgD family transcriptional regulator/N-acetylneuraminic acid mutarotase